MNETTDWLLEWQQLQAWMAMLQNQGLIPSAEDHAWAERVLRIGERRAQQPWTIEHHERFEIHNLLMTIGRYYADWWQHLSTSWQLGFPNHQDFQIPLNEF